MITKVIRLLGLFDTESQTHQAGSVYDIQGLAPCLDTSGGGYRQPLIIERTEKSTMNPRIRKLVPVETIKLMGFERKDYQALRDIGQSDAQIYHECGDSIVVTCLMGIFGQMLFDEDTLKNKIEKYVETLKEN